MEKVKREGEEVKGVEPVREDAHRTPAASEYPKAPKALPGLIDWTKPVRTKGRKMPVTVYAVDLVLRKPVVGRVHDEYHDLNDWDINGVFHASQGPCGLDLENVPEPVRAEGDDPLVVELVKALRAMRTQAAEYGMPTSLPCYTLADAALSRAGRGA